MEGAWGVLWSIAGVMLAIMWLDHVGFAARHVPPRKSSNWTLLEYSRGYLGFCGLFVLLSCVSVVGIILKAPREQTIELVVFPALMLGTVLFTWLLLRDALSMQIRFNDTHIQKRSPYVDVSLEWKEIERVQYSSNWHALVLNGGGKRLRISRYVIGFSHLAKEIRYNAPTESLRDVEGYLASLELEVP